MASSASTRDEKGRFVETDPPLVVINNPLTSFKKWWKKVMANEGVDFRLTIHPLTAIAIASVIGVGSFGLGRITLPQDNPIVQYLPQFAPQPTPNPWRETAYHGILRKTSAGNSYFLQTDKAEAVTLEVPGGISLAPLVGKRIFAVGKYNENTQILAVSEATDLELLPTNATYLPGVSPKPTLLPSSLPDPSLEPSTLPDATPTEAVETNTST